MKYEVIETEKNTWLEDGSPSITDRWACASEYDALTHAHIRSVEARILGRSDSDYEAVADGKPIDHTDWDAPEDDVVYAALVEMGYTTEQVRVVLG